MSAEINYHALAQQIKEWGKQLGFQQLGIADTELTEAEAYLYKWLDDGMHGEMEYMSRHGSRRTRPDELIPGTIRIVSARMDYFPAAATPIAELLQAEELAFISRYALGKDYHKLMRKRLERLAHKIREEVGPFGYRAFTDSAPVLEKPIAQKAGLGWIGKHTNLINRDAGSWFFLAELYTDLPLPVDAPADDHCGQCSSCISACPTGAITAPYVVDARRCISYLTIELKDSIPEDLRPLLGNRIFGCDDCQLVCPWNRFSKPAKEPGFAPRDDLDGAALVELFHWTADEFDRRTAGSAIRRIGYQQWLRNIAVALGNCASEPAIEAALRSRADDPSPLVREHVFWALGQHGWA